MRGPFVCNLLHFFLSHQRLFEKISKNCFAFHLANDDSCHGYFITLFMSFIVISYKLFWKSAEQLSNIHLLILAPKISLFHMFDESNKIFQIVLVFGSCNIFRTVINFYEASVYKGISTIYHWSITTPGVHSRNYWVSAIKKTNQIANRTLNVEAGNGNCWQPCHHEKKLPLVWNILFIGYTDVFSAH